MYEEKRFVRRRINWLSVLIKLLLLFLIVFLIWYFIIRKTGKSNTTKVKGYPITENLDYLKKEYIKYFDEKNIPKVINDEVTIKLSELIDNKKSREIYDKKGNKCSSSSSYGKVTKTDKDNYILKVYLKCKNEADSLVIPLTKKDIINNNVDVKNTNNQNNNNNTNNNNNSNNKNNNNKNNNNNNNNSNNNNKTNNNKSKNTKTITGKTNTNTNNTNTKKNNTQNNNNKSQSTNNNTSNTQKNTNTNTLNQNNNNNTNNNNASNNTQQSTKTNTKQNNNATNTNNSNTNTNNSNNANTNSNQNNKPAPVDESKVDPEKIKKDPKNVVLKEYLMYKLGKETDEPIKGKKYITHEKQIQYYKYCIEGDMYNCHRNFAKTPENIGKIQNLLDRGFTEYPDYTKTIYTYVPILDELWSRTDKVDGYVFSGKTRTHYKIS